MTTPPPMTRRERVLFDLGCLMTVAWSLLLAGAAVKLALLVLPLVIH